MTLHLGKIAFFPLLLALFVVTADLSVVDTSEILAIAAGEVDFAVSLLVIAVEVSAIH